MKAIILAAGMATRLRPLTNDLPKSLLPVNDRRIIQLTVDSLVKQNIVDFIIVTGYFHEKIESFLRYQYPQLNFCFIINDQFDKTNNIYSLWLALNHSEPDDIILLDSDIVYDSRLIENLLVSPYEDVVSVVRHPMGEEEMKVQVDQEGYIFQISKTSGAESAVGESLGIEKFGKKYISFLLKELNKMIMIEGLQSEYYELAFSRLAQKGIKLRYIDISNYFAMEIDTLEDYNLCVNHFLEIPPLI